MSVSYTNAAIFDSSDWEDLVFGVPLLAVPPVGDCLTASQSFHVIGGQLLHKDGQHCGKMSHQGYEVW